MNPNEFPAGFHNDHEEAFVGVQPANFQMNMPRDPMHINMNENIGVPLVSQLLEGAENYITWKNAMVRALGFKMKLGFIYGRFEKPQDPYDLARWEMCNNAVISWITNSVSKEIATSLIHMDDASQAWTDLEIRYGGTNAPMIFAVQEEISKIRQGDMNVAAYYNKLYSLWAEEDTLVIQDLCELGSGCKSTRCMQNKKELDRSMKFLMGLNEAHFPIRSQILGMDPIPNIGTIYNKVRQDEKQQGLNRGTNLDSSAMTVSQTSSANGPVQPNNQGGNQDKKNLYCHHCKMKGHSKETCYKIHGYPPGYKPRKNSGNNTNRGTVNNVTVDNDSAGNLNKNDSQDSQAQIHALKSQVDKLVAMFSGSTNAGNHMAGHNKEDFPMAW